MPEPYPALPLARNGWVVGLRGPRNPVCEERPYHYVLEPERSHTGAVVEVATVFVTNRECPWRCVMCDLWRNTLESPVRAGSVAAQVSYALARLGPAQQVKLYNSGSFFDERAIPPADDEAIARRVGGFERVVVESHPALVGARCLRFSDLLGSAQLEVAMGLETAHPAALARLNKGVTLDGFMRAADLLRMRGVERRVFLLVGVPFIEEAEAAEAFAASLACAWACGAGVVSLIATRGGNGAMEQLAAAGEWRAPGLHTLESAFAQALASAPQGARVFADTWNTEALCGCACAAQRVARLRAANLAQVLPPRVPCELCGGAAA